MEGGEVSRTMTMMAPQGTRKKGRQKGAMGRQKASRGVPKGRRSGRPNSVLKDAKSASRGRQKGAEGTPKRAFWVAPKQC